MESLPVVLLTFGVDVPSAKVQQLGNSGGMSGAQLWKVSVDAHTLCLRRWPAAHPSRERLEWIHSQMRLAYARGCEFVPRVSAGVAGSTIVRREEHFWELTSWMPGQADFVDDPTDERLIEAARGVASFHVATTPPPREQYVHASPGIEQRRRALDQVSPAQLDDWLRRIDTRHGEATAETCRHILTAARQTLEACRQQVARVADTKTALQPCLRDVWHDHLLFAGSRLSGIVDYGAMASDSPASDLARMLGSLVPNQPQRWHTALHAYERIRPLSVDEHRLLAAFDFVNPVLSGLNWIRWLYVEDRRFEAMTSVAKRLTAIASRIRDGKF